MATLVFHESERIAEPSRAESPLAESPLEVLGPEPLPLEAIRYVLPEDVDLKRIAELPEWARDSLGAPPNDYAITRRFSRSSSKILSEAAGSMLEEFRTPKTLVEAVISFSEKQECDAEAILDRSGRLLLRLIDEDLLCIEGTEQARATKPTFETGAELDGVQIRECLQLLEDTEVYRGRRPDGSPVAIKIARSAKVTPYIREMFAREARLLREAGPDITPEVYADGEWEGSPYLILEWINGIPLSEAISLYKKNIELEPRLTQQILRARSLELIESVAVAYATLHERGILHGDVHPRNVMIEAETEKVRLIDFGYAQRVEEDSWARAGVPSYYDPQLALAFWKGTPAPAPTPASEQYSVGVMTYQLISDPSLAHGDYLPFSTEPEQLLEQIITHPPVPLTSYFMTQDRGVESVILTALAKDPAARHPSLRAFADRLKEAAANRVHPLPGETDEPILESDTTELPPARERRQRLVDATVNLARPGAIWEERCFQHAPACSVNYGAAGVAYMLYRIGLARDDAQLLAQADHWCQSAFTHQNSPLAWHSKTVAIDEKSVGNLSPYHAISGVYLVHALIQDAQGNLPAVQEGVDGFAHCIAGTPCDNLDLTLGKSAALLGGAILVEALAGNRYIGLGKVREAGNRLINEVWTEADTYGPLSPGNPMTYLGIAHGWSGLCYAALRWCSALDLPRESEPVNLRARVEELAGMGLEYGPGVRWPYEIGMTTSVAGWCNGHAGLLFFWLEAYRRYGDPLYLTLAERVGQSVWEDLKGIASLCCGAAGKAYALLALHRATGDITWFRRGMTTADYAVDITETGYSLYKSMSGVAVLAADLENPEFARMPLFEREPGV